MTDQDAVSKSVLLVGGPDAGKTNYLARLWMALDTGVGVIRKNGLPLQSEYLRTLASSLLSGDFAPRSAPGLFQPTTIPLRWQESGELSFGELVVPDCAGERWERINQAREWSSEWENTINSLAGCLLFYRVSSLHNVPALDWSTDADLLRCMAAKPASTENSPDVKLPTQVMLVDWLQCLRAAHQDVQGAAKPLRTAIIVTAWDMAPKESKKSGPDKYLNTELPLLYDFLATNEGSFRSKVFGVSVADMDLTNARRESKTKYLDGDPNTSGSVVFASRGTPRESKDITIPLAWAFGCSVDTLLDSGDGSQ